MTTSEILKKLKEKENNIEERLDKIESEIEEILGIVKQNKELIKKGQSIESFFKNWGGFYLASLAADETLGLNNK